MRAITIPATAEKTLIQDIHAFTHDLANGSVAVAVGLGSNESGEFVFEPGQTFSTVIINGDNYRDLMAANGGAENRLPGKPAGTFRKDDLWVFIDLVAGL